jgi:Asp-tRNA(Asn)/Glu-tRNA(Gln) amidotransferase A subunit family amidase
MCQQGATDREVAQRLDVAEGTLYRWRHEHPEFRESLRLGKESADDRVEKALYNRAVGYSFDSIKIMQYEGEVIVEPYVEHVPPDVGAAKLWLTNRRGREWRDKVLHQGDPENPLTFLIAEMNASKSQLPIAPDDDGNGD